MCNAQRGSFGPAWRSFGSQRKHWYKFGVPYEDEKANVAVSSRATNGIMDILQGHAVVSSNTLKPSCEKKILK